MVVCREPSIAVDTHPTSKAVVECRKLLALEAGDVERQLEHIERVGGGGGCGRLYLAEVLSRCLTVLECSKYPTMSLTRYVILAFILLAAGLATLSLGVYAPIVEAVLAAVASRVLRVPAARARYTLLWSRDPPLCGLQNLAFTHGATRFVYYTLIGLAVYSTLYAAASVMYRYSGLLSTLGTPVLQPVYGSLSLTYTLLVGAAAAFSFALIFYAIMAFAVLVAVTGRIPFVSPETGYVIGTGLSGLIVTAGATLGLIAASSVFALPYSMTVVRAAPPLVLASLAIAALAYVLSRVKGASVFANIATAALYSLVAAAAVSLGIFTVTLLDAIMTLDPSSLVKSYVVLVSLVLPTVLLVRYLERRAGGAASLVLLAGYR